MKNLARASLGTAAVVVAAALVLVGCGSGTAQDGATQNSAASSVDSATSVSSDEPHRLVPPVPGDPGGIAMPPPGIEPYAGPPGSIAERIYAGSPPRIGEPGQPPPPAPFALIEPGGLLALALPGSACSTYPVALEAVDRHQVRVTASDDHGETACAAIGMAHTSLIRLDPNLVDVTTDLTVHIDGIELMRPTVTAPPRG